MRWRFILKIIGILTFIFGLTMIFPIFVGLYYQDQSVNPALKAMGITAVAGLILFLFFRNDKAEIISQREGMAIVALGWISVGLFGALPLYFSDPDLPPPVHPF
jgi:trk system potassium uptake protein TrkH